MTNRECIIIYGKPGCVFCTKAKEFLSYRFIPYTYIDITEDLSDWDKAAINRVIATGYRTMPMIFIDGEFIGGYSDLEKRGFE